MIDYRKGAIDHTKTSEGGTGASLVEGQQACKAKDEPCVLAINLMEKICSRANLNRAYKRVKTNKGAPGVDGINVNELYDYIK